MAINPATGQPYTGIINKVMDQAPPPPQTGTTVQLDRQSTIAPPKDPLQTSNPPGLNGGLVNSTPPPSASLPPAPVAPSYTTTPANVSTYTATPYSVPREGLVQDQVLKIVGDDSPLMQQARQRAAQEANARGLVNSSIAVGAGEQAVIAQALPMAQQDAQTYANAATNTANQQNAASQFNTGAQNTVGLANAQQENAALANNQQSAVQLANTRMNNEAQVALANLDTQTRIALSTMDTQTRQLLQTNQSASNAYVQAVTNISNITTSNTMSQEAKDRAVQSQLNLLNEQLRTIGTLAGTSPTEIADLNLGEFFQDINGVNPTADDSIARIQAESDRQFGGHWEQQPMVPEYWDENGYHPASQPADVWVKNA